MTAWHDENKKKCVALLSGGMDSTTLVYKLIAEGWDVKVLSIDYGQRHSRELMCGDKIAKQLKLFRKVVKIDLTQFGDSPLTNYETNIPLQKENKQRNTVVGYRNTLFCTLAAAYAQTQNIRDLFIAPCAEDFKAYRDCRPEFYESLELSLPLGGTQEEWKVKIHTPFIRTYKRDIVALGKKLDPTLDLFLGSWSCYEGEEPSCGLCDACCERISAFKDNGIKDPIRYGINIDWDKK